MSVVAAGAARLRHSTAKSWGGWCAWHHQRPLPTSEDEINTYVENRLLLDFQEGIEWRRHIYQGGCWTAGQLRANWKRSNTKRIMKSHGTSKPCVNYQIKLSQDFVKSTKANNCRWPLLTYFSGHLSCLLPWKSKTLVMPVLLRICCYHSICLIFLVNLY